MKIGNLKYFLAGFFVMIIFGGGINILEKNLKNNFFWLQFSKNQNLLKAQIAEENFWRNLYKLKPIKKKGAQRLEINAESCISLFLSNEGKEKILFQKNPNLPLPIASLTKLMTAKVVLDYYDLSQQITISKKAIAQEENLGKLKPGEKLTVKDLLYPLLIESSNDAAFSLANDYPFISREKFLYLMNFEAKTLNLKNTHFVNETGLDPDPPKKDINYSTAFDIAHLAKSLLKEKIIWEILSIPKIKFYGRELETTNEFLKPNFQSPWKKRLIGGKTGYTPKAKGCFLTVLKAKKGKGLIINVILGSDKKFKEMKKLIDWVENSYIW